MPNTQRSIDARAAFHAAVVTTAARLAPGHGIPEQRHLALLAEAPPPPLPRVWTDTAALTLAAVLVSRARRDALSEGLALIDRYFVDTRLTREATLSDDARAHLLAAAGEYCCAIGWPQIGAQYGAEALLFADTAPVRYRAHAVLALGHALNGEYESSENDRAAAQALFADNAWPDDEIDYLVLLAESLVAAAWMQSDRLAAVSTILREVRPDDPYWDYSARAIDVVRGLFERDYSGALAANWQLSYGSRRHRSHRMIRDLLTCIGSDILVARGEYAEALATLSTGRTPPGHGICFPMQRSVALLLLGRDRELLAETEACVADETDHCLRTLTPTLLRRAIAFARIGSARRAAQSMEAALLLISRTGGSITPFIMLPLGETLALFDEVVSARPELGPVVTGIRDFLPSVAAPSLNPAEVTGFTPTERELAVLLSSDRNLADIARERGVSLNTVKSQVRSIYAKLGVSGRAEAVGELLRRTF
ncbi:LuxR family transcriptional regulator [Microbacterium sp. Kw_RZR3]|jgi:DNA-binding CsgD family transcriptional regulator|uniref:helix-turn-helix transcriptional regulator n=1 Tax=unclassified Microbacterium TaxID=2609290 RepID=UPI0023DC86B4|nr:LuxR family transcriptional regulator [Microbacterium sp. Kw_RZR3]MDF2048076.1 LuxR C-terminal-related transcriptional regulator [Microbacterium sp. Kw_RZR3]